MSLKQLDYEHNGAETDIGNIDEALDNDAGPVDNPGVLPGPALQAGARGVVGEDVYLLSQLLTHHLRNFSVHC